MGFEMQTRNCLVQANSNLQEYLQGPFEACLWVSLFSP
ncbi:hypothetical protein SNOG_16402 [Parastagonospora nodorum SN15]|uniref:Uncharacterized protein n=1 Tax=Phaeosphaeria nodorum (strain SN15 / ATCC MYA-4574 / FGSC 10173) TaxID=321614 RepID=Q0TVS5_PHANO|nr:hypothetical protein SNOG_16402 [Parastagonospora nodorum SN15]EAT76227.1 hypothetical protein SNOG_16402 [Parastagonospora nodorum SN15]